MSEVNEHSTPSFPYVHGYSAVEQARLHKQAELFEHTIYHEIDLSNAKRLVEIGSGVGAQTSILMRRFPRLHVDCVERNERQLAAARGHLDTLPYAKGRYQLHIGDAENLDFDSGTFDAAFCCWILEHTPNPARVLTEARRAVRPGGLIIANEVMNSSFFLNPYSPALWRYWMAFNDYQYAQAGDPFVGAKLGNLLQSTGWRDVRTSVKYWHFDNREPHKRREAIRFWKELLLSGAATLTASGVIDEDLVKAMKEEFKQVEADPDAVFFYAWVQATAING